MHALFTSLNCNNNYLNMSPQNAHELYGTTQHNTINTIQYNTIEHGTTQYNDLSSFQKVLKAR